jgi:hypothetical protein
MALNLLAVEAAVHDLPEIEASWESEPSINQQIYRDEWWDVMARLRELDCAYHRRELPGDQAERLRVIARRLEQALPIAQRIGLASPPVAVAEIR